LGAFDCSFGIASTGGTTKILEGENKIGFAFRPSESSRFSYLATTAVLMAAEG